jgi:hypothetical protein
MAPIFRKNSLQKVLSMSRPKFWVSSRGRKQLEGEEARVGDSLRLQQDMALPPRRFAYKLLVRTKLSQPGSPKKMGRQNNTIAENKQRAFQFTNIEVF